MAYYAYKTVRDLLPEFIIKKQGEDYEGDGNYDGDQWYAAEDYIIWLKSKIPNIKELEEKELTEIKL